MKKILLSLLALMSVTFVSAQELGGYTPAISNGTYTPLEGGTVVNAGIPASDLSGKVILSDAYSPDSWTAATGKAFSIGFDFPFNGKTFSYFAIGANGAIKLSETEDTKVMFASWNICFSTPDNGGENLIMAYDKSAKSYAADNAEGKDTTVISYKSTDEELVVEYKNLGINTSSWGTDLKGTYDLQIRLKKDGTITYVYSGLADLAETSAGQVYLGIKGNDDGNGNRDLLTWESLACKTKSWNSPSAFNLSAVADGYTITLNTPGETTTPTVQGALEAKIISQMDYSTNKAYPQAQASFTAVDGADKYLMLIKKGDATDVPEDGVTYEKGGQCGDSYVMYAGTAYNFNIFSDALEAATTYTVTLYAYNCFGKGGAKYNTVDAPSVTLKTPAGAPKSMKLVEATKNSLKVAVEPNANNDLVYVVYNDKTWNPGNMGSRAYTGTPDAAAVVGDALYTNIDERSGEVEEGKNEEAGKVAYFGGKGSFELTDLEAGKSYYFIAYSYDRETKTFDLEPDTLQLAASTNIVAPYKMDLSDAPATCAPGGWVSNPAGNSTGFWAAVTDDANVTHNGKRAFECQNEDWEHVYTLTSPVIELGNNTMSFDWHIHQKSGWGWFATPAPLDPEENWADTDYIKFVLYVDGEEVELKKIDKTNAPADETADDWHSETVDVSQYAGKNVQFGVKWLCGNSNTTYLGFDNFAVSPKYTLNFSADYDEMCDVWGVYADGERLEYPYDNDNPYTFAEGTQISVGGMCIDADVMHEMVVTVNGEEVPADAFDPDTKVYTFTLTQDTDIKIEFKDPAPTVVATWTATASDDYPSSWGWSNDIVISGYDCTVEKYSDGTCKVLGWGGEDGNAFTFTPNAWGIDYINGEDTWAGMYTGRDDYYYASLYVPYEYVAGLGEETGYIILYGWFYKDADDAGTWGTVYLSWGDYVVTGINSVNAAEDNAPVYNIAGQRVNNATKGIVIKNGKKYLVK